MKTLNPQIYVTYKTFDNTNHQIGAWVDAAQKVFFIEHDINRIYDESDFCESRTWHIQGFKDFAGVESKLAQDINEIAQVAQFLKEYGTLGAYVMNHLANPLDNSPRQVLLNHYKGAVSSLRQFAEFYINDHRSLEPLIASVIDYGKLADALFKDEFIYTRLEDKKFYVFSKPSSLALVHTTKTKK